MRPPTPTPTLDGLDLTELIGRRHGRHQDAPVDGALVLQPTTHLSLRRTRSGTAPRWCSARATPAPTTWWATSSPTATSSTPRAVLPAPERGHQRVGRRHDRRDRRPPQPGVAPSDAGWTIGEDLPGGGAIRSLKDPPLLRPAGQDDQSPTTTPADIYDDNGAVHLNDGVGNKTAYLISQGGTFNGQTDHRHRRRRRRARQDRPALPRGDPAAHLRRASTPTSGASWSPPATSSRPRRTGGFTTADCDSVRAAVAATELEPPATAAARPPQVAVDGARPAHALDLLAAGRRRHPRFGFTADRRCGSAPGRRHARRTPAAATSSLFALGPRPDGRRRSSTGRDSAAFTVPAHGRDVPALPPRLRHGLRRRHGYYDGGQVLVQKLSDGTWTTVNGLPWVNGPTRHIVGSTRELTGLRWRQPRLRLQPGEPHLAGRPDRARGVPRRGRRGRRRLRLVDRRHPPLHLRRRRRLRPATTVPRAGDARARW